MGAGMGAGTGAGMGAGTGAGTGVSIPSTADSHVFITLLGRSDDGTLFIGDPAYGSLELRPSVFSARYGSPELVLALAAAPRNK